MNEDRRNVAYERLYGVGRWEAARQLKHILQRSHVLAASANRSDRCNSATTTERDDAYKVQTHTTVIITL